MTQALVMALAYLRVHRGLAVALVVSLGLVMAVPAGARLVLRAAEATFGARAAATPLVLGARGSSLDLTLAALYFDGTAPTPMPQAAVDAVWDSGLGQAIPLYLGLTAQGAPVVGTTLDYFAHRGLAVAAGRPLAQIGEAVLGAGAARRLGIGPGDMLVTDAQTLFDLGGVYPLELAVAGVLAPSGSADDGAVFVDLKTAWIAAGIGHGHDPQEGAASPALRQFTRITPDTVTSFHLHGDPGVLPVSAAIVVPGDTAGAAILRGRYLEGTNPQHLVVPADVVAGLLERLFRVGRILDGVAAILGLAAALAIGQALVLASELRRDERATLHRLGVARGAILATTLAPLAVMMALGVALAALIVTPLIPLAPAIATALVAGQP